ncbi:hypothetical protein CSR02_02960 [Acetobacter pomorum]|uniref:Uncharacterized protein n=1 Tax=Acetobacter pomorum TaxID=65959 RepID=A0A2G4REP9_9PROT|nr:hypothetical protein [Acetobacter pomorum]PHY95046.1 hypothetical protein CSR02_02960 [Acetobacter pomorum]GBR51213.1 hypothetical protein AA11825_1910 [Acetobacter pomorum DSM 11825]
MKNNPTRKELAKIISEIQLTENNFSKVENAYFNAISSRDKLEQNLEEARKKVSEAKAKKASLMADRLLGQKVTAADPVNAAQVLEREAQLSLSETEALINELKRRKEKLEEERERLTFKRSNLIKDVVSESAFAIHLHQQVADAAKTLLDATKSLKLLRDRGFQVPYPEGHKPADDTLERIDTLPSSWIENRIPGTLQLSSKWAAALTALETNAFAPLPEE